MRLRLLAFATALPLTLADVDFSAPSGGASFTAGSPITVKWSDGSGKTPLSDLAGYQIFLVAGGNSDSTSQLLPATDGVSGDHSLKTTSATVAPKAADGPPGQNAYYIKIVSAKKGGGQVVNYSNRFTISGMTGKWQSDAIQQAYKAAAGSPDSVPPTQDGGAANGGAAGKGDVQDYTMQTGATRYAPMQQNPPTKITKQDTKALYPTSHFTISPTYWATPEAQTTATVSRQNTFETKENNATPAPMPGQDGSDNAQGVVARDMHKYLNRWKD